MNIEEVAARAKLRRKISGAAAMLYPYRAPGECAGLAFVANLRAVDAAGLTCAVNMDTGYVNVLTPAEKLNVMKLTRAALGPNTPFIAGAYIERLDGDPVQLYRAEIGTILEFGATPIIIQTSRMHGMSPLDKAHIYAEACSGAPAVLGFELGKQFAPNGEIWDDETFKRMLDIPAMVGLKHSSLDRLTELRRLEMRDRLRPEFVIYTGNDLGIDMIEYGSDYLLGLAAFCPGKFAERDTAWERGDASYYALNDALQHLGNTAFRNPVPAYKHSAAIFLHLLGKIPTNLTHPDSPNRPEHEAELMAGCAARLGLLP